MIFINEWLPNPVGNDAQGEFIELYNNGTASVSLDGWFLKTTGKKNFLLDGYSIAANGYLVLKKAQTKLTLKNTNETISLYDPGGHLADQSSFLGAAQEGKSLSRINYATDPSDHFAWSDPTPGAANDITLNMAIAANNYPMNVPLNHPAINGAEILGMVLALGAFFAALVVYSLKHDEHLQKLFFPRDR